MTSHDVCWMCLAFYLTVVIEVEEDERNLIYVAMTRAKRTLVISPTILSVLKRVCVNERSLSVKCEQFLS